MKRRFKRGVTIAEAVVAMTVITIVSVTAISTVRQGLKYSSRAEYSAAARRDAGNALECFKLAEDNYEFSYTLPYTNLIISRENEDIGKYVYRYGVLYETEINVEFGEPGRAGDSFTAVCSDKDGEELFSLSYTKG